MKLRSIVNNDVILSGDVLSVACRVVLFHSDAVMKRLAMKGSQKNSIQDSYSRLHDPIISKARSTMGSLRPEGAALAPRNHHVHQSTTIDTLTSLPTHSAGNEM